MRNLAGPSETSVATSEWTRASTVSQTVQISLRLELLIPHQNASVGTLELPENPASQDSVSTRMPAPKFMTQIYELAKF